MRSGVAPATLGRSQGGKTNDQELTMTMTESTDVLRADTWDQFMGQPELKRTMRIHIDAASTHGRLLPHTLLVTEPGYGKTTLAHIIAEEMNEQIMEITMPIKPKRLAARLRNWPIGGVLFLDEIHRARPAQQEDLLSMLQDGWLQTDSGDRIPTNHLTIIGASTEQDKIIKPLWDRFEIKPVFQPYTDDEMAKIVTAMGEKLDIEFASDTALRLGRATGGTPRVARSLTLAARSLGDTGRAVTVEEILRLAGVDEDGLSDRHIAYLQALKDLDGAGGLEKVMAQLAMPRTVIVEMERLLVKRKLIRYGSGGRELLSAGYAKLKNETESVSEDVVVERRRRKVKM